MKRATLVAGAASLLAGAAHAGEAITFVETFEEPITGNWTFFGGDVLLDDGGNPGAYLRAQGLDTFAPRARTQGDSIFTGDYRDQQVMSLGIDLNTFAVNTAGGRPLSLLLVSFNGTPDDVDDDYAAYFIGPDNIPFPGEGWVSYDFEVPSQETSLPAGWAWQQFGPDAPADPDWNVLMSDVDQVRYFYGDPEQFFIFQVWDVGMDNARITYIPGPATAALAALALAGVPRRRRG